jgi:glycosyltransferase involved in cell wall biosynthesis
VSRFGADLAGELIVVDTGSTDATPSIAAGYGAEVIPFDFTVVDFAAARNCAIARAQRPVDPDARRG